MKKIFSLLFTISCCIIIFSSCQKDFSNEFGTAQLASGSLRDSSGNCLPDTVIGTFYDGVTPGSDTAYVEIQVNVTQTGSYSIYTDLQNGFKFADSGFFTTTGINTVRLKPLGTPILPNATTFNVSFDSSLCSFTVNVQDSTGTGLGGIQDSTGNGDPDHNAGTWQFSTVAGAFTGIIDTAFITTDSVWNSGGQVLFLEGNTVTQDTLFHIILYLPSNTITTGAYNTQALPPSAAAVFDFNSASSLNPIYFASPDTSSASNVTININSYDDVTHIVTATFSGLANDSTGNPVVNITSGSFTAKVD